jgi:RNA polymerase sigma-70 factor (ECF subfamily)
MSILGAHALGASLAEIETVYRRRGAEFERVATAIVRDREIARDVVQDAFVTLVQRRGSFARRGTVDAWAWKAVVNTALNRRRTTRRHAVTALDDLADYSGTAVEREVDRRVLASLNELPERQRLVVFLRYYADLDYATIGASLGISPGTVASALNSAHRSLHRHLATEVTQ